SAGGSSSPHSIGASAGVGTLRPVRILVFHGYLLEGTGSNVYNARLAEALVRLGHDVHLLSQDRHAEEQPFVDAVGDWDGGALSMRQVRAPQGPGRCSVYRPDIGGLPPVAVAGRYEGVEARRLPRCTGAPPAPGTRAATGSFASARGSARRAWTWPASRPGPPRRRRPRCARSRWRWRRAAGALVRRRAPSRATRARAHGRCGASIRARMSWSRSWAS